MGKDGNSSSKTRRSYGPAPIPEKAEDRKAAVRAAALKMVVRKDQSVQELTEKLTRKFRGWPEDLDEFVRDAVSKMEACGAVDDVRRARNMLLAESRKGSPGSLARNAINKGKLDRELVEEVETSLRADGELPSGDDVLTRLFETKFKSKPPMDEKEKRRQARFFMTKGFSWKEISALWGRNTEDDEN